MSKPSPSAEGPEVSTVKTSGISTFADFDKRMAAVAAGGAHPLTESMLGAIFREMDDAMQRSGDTHATLAVASLAIMPVTSSVIGTALLNISPEARGPLAAFLRCQLIEEFDRMVVATGNVRP